MFKGTIKKILIIKWSALGDIILITPALRVIREHFPEAKIFLLTKKEYQDLLKPLHYIDSFIDFEKSEWKGLIPELKKESFDLSIDFQNTWLSHLLVFLSGVKNRVGYKRKGGGAFLNIAAFEPKGIKNPVEHQAHLLSKIGIDLTDYSLECRGASIQTSFNLSKPYIVILPGAGKGWETKCWGESSFARLADTLIDKYGYSVVFLGEIREKEKISRIKKLMRERAEDLSGKTDLKELAGVLKESALFITHDTGPMHLAQALKVPTVALFGPTDPRRHTVPSTNLFIVKKSLACQPCYRRDCSHQQCLQLIEVKEVLEVVSNVLNERIDNLK